MARNDGCRQDVFLEEDAGPLVCLLTFLCFSHSSSMLQPVLLKTELVEKGFTLWKGRKNNEWMYPCPLKSHSYLQHVPKELAKQKAPRSIWCRGHLRNTHSSLGRHFLHPGASSETQLQQSQLLPFLVCEVISHSRHWLMMVPTFSQTLTSVFSYIPLTKFNGNITHLLPSLCHAENFQKTYSWSKENPLAKILTWIYREEYEQFKIQNSISLVTVGKFWGFKMYQKICTLSKSQGFICNQAWDTARQSNAGCIPGFPYLTMLDLRQHSL